MKLRLNTADFSSDKAVYLSRETFDSPAFQQLSCDAKAAYHFEIVRLYRWQDDGVIEISPKQLALRAKLSEAAARNVLQELLRAGIVERVPRPRRMLAVGGLDGQEYIR